MSTVRYRLNYDFFLSYQWKELIIVFVDAGTKMVYIFVTDDKNRSGENNIE